jgi:hypothetical protein
MHDPLAPEAAVTLALLTLTHPIAQTDVVEFQVYGARQVQVPLAVVTLLVLGIKEQFQIQLELVAFQESGATQAQDPLTAVAFVLPLTREQLRAQLELVMFQE